MRAHPAGGTDRRHRLMTATHPGALAVRHVQLHRRAAQGEGGRLQLCEGGRRERAPDACARRAMRKMSTQVGVGKAGTWPRCQIAGGIQVSLLSPSHTTMTSASRTSEELTCRHSGSLTGDSIAAFHKRDTHTEKKGIMRATETRRIECACADS